MSRRDTQIPDGSRRKYQNDSVGKYIKYANSENKYVVPNTMISSYERIPDCFLWDTSEDGEKSANKVESTSG